MQQSLLLGTPSEGREAKYLAHCEIRRTILPISFRALIKYSEQYSYELGLLTQQPVIGETPARTLHPLVHASFSGDNSLVDKFLCGKPFPLDPLEKFDSFFLSAENRLAADEVVSIFNYHLRVCCYS